ncbi:MAG: hypothetical protein IT374_20505 [Polyangiaceae bacterium]|nr:hypothetical protein [Polyangiaceae bacterium]
MTRAGVAAALLLVGCGGGGARPATPPAAATPIDPALPPEAARWLPAEDDAVLAFDTEDLVAKTRGVMMLRVRRVGGGRVELVGPKRVERLQLSPSGLMREAEGTYLLRLPVVVGATWPAGPNASLSLARAGVSIKVKAGEFDGCVETVERRTGAVQGTLTTTLCPNVGIVRIETKGEASASARAPGAAPVEIHEVVELRSFQRAIDLGPAGVTQTEVGR